MYCIMHCIGNNINSRTGHFLWSQLSVDSCNTVIRTTFRLSTGGATGKRDRSEADAAICRLIFYGSDVNRSLRRF